MTLTVGDLSAIAGMVGIATATWAGVTRYFVKAEVKGAIDGLRLELVQQRLTDLESRRVMPVAESALK